MFNYKTQAELSTMTPQEVEQYSVSKRTHEQENVKNEASRIATEKFNELSKELEKMQTSENAFTPDSAEFKAMQDTIANINKSIDDLGKNKSKGILGVNKKVGARFQELHKAKEAGTLDQQSSQRGEALRIETKAFDSLNVHTVNDVSSGDYPANGTLSAVSGTYRTVYSQILGMFDVPRVYSKIMDVVSVSPLISDTLIAFNRTITSGFAITPECIEKPVSKISIAAQTVTADPVASLFYTTLHMRAFYPALVNDFVQTFRTLLSEAIPNFVMEEIRDNAIPYTPVADLEWASPSYFEAIVAVDASLKKLGYSPNMIALSPIDYALMITETGSDRHYKLQNGSSIVLVDGTVKIGSNNLTIVEDPFLENGEFLLGDAQEAVKVGLGSDVFYFETDGVTDNQNSAPTAPATGLARNIRTHELAQFVAVMLPDGAKGALIRDTFDNVITLITEA